MPSWHRGSVLCTRPGDALGGGAVDPSEVLFVDVAPPPPPPAAVAVSVPAVATTRTDGLPGVVDPRGRNEASVAVWRAAGLPAAQVVLAVSGRPCATSTVAPTHVVRLHCRLSPVGPVTVVVDGATVASWPHRSR